MPTLHEVKSPKKINPRAFRRASDALVAAFFGTIQDTHQPPSKTFLMHHMSSFV
jgi:hypothetical protein